MTRERSPDPPLDHATRLALERTALAHERTLVAWVRTCFSMIGFGLTIYTFLVTRAGEKATAVLAVRATKMCLALIACGVLFMLLAAIQHRKSIRRLFRSGMEAQFSLAQFAAILVSGVGIVGFWLVLVGF